MLNLMPDEQPLAPARGAVRGDSFPTRSFNLGGFCASACSIIRHELSIADKNPGAQGLTSNGTPLFFDSQRTTVNSFFSIACLMIGSGPNKTEGLSS
jgi:hypothetical protein